MAIKDFAKDVKEIAGKAADAATEAAKNIGDGVSDFAGKAADVAVETAKNVGEGVNEIAGKATDVAAEAAKSIKLAYYKPVFQEDYDSPDYDRPDIIVIEDGDKRKKIDVCEGAIGWFGKAGEMEVLHLYMDALPSDIAFYPNPSYDAVFYENKVNPGRFINLDCFFDVIEKDRLTELRRIAYDLGAKSCRLESYEEAKATRRVKAQVGEKGHATIDEPSNNSKKMKVSENASVQAELESSGDYKKSIIFAQTFAGNAEPRRPDLVWFKNDKEIEFLIDTRCNGDNSNKTMHYSIELSKGCTQTMSGKTAGKLDRAVGQLGLELNFSLEGEAKTEARKRFFFEIDF